MKTTHPTPQPADDAFRWIPVSDTPKVGGTYMAGKYVEDGVLPRRFQRFWTTLILTVDGPEWADPGVEYYYPLPPHPQSETAYVLCMSDEVPASVEAVAEIKMSRPSSELRHGDHRPEPYAAFKGKLPPVGTKLYTARAIQAGKGEDLLSPMFPGMKADLAKVTTGATLIASFENPDWNQVREHLESEVVAAASALMAHTEAAGMTLDKDGISIHIAPTAYEGVVS